MMFRPRDSHDLRLLDARLEIYPRPTRLRWLHDVFDNSMAIATFDGATSELRVDSVVTLEHVELTLPDYPLEASAQTYPFHYSADESPNLARALAHHYPSEAVAQWVRQFLDPSGTIDTLSLLRAITRAIQDECVYTRRPEKGIQSPTETLQRRRGSCRDLAVLMMEAMRALGLAARFVSGYLYVPHVDAGRAVGGGATHAWMQVYLPGAGWVDFDPTNNIIGNRNLIRVAVAWDPSLVLPLWGTFIGSPSSVLGMDVTVTVTADDCTAAQHTATAHRHSRPYGEQV